jgi:hypothetical protein
VTTPRLLTLDRHTFGILAAGVVVAGVRFWWQRLGFHLVAGLAATALATAIAALRLPLTEALTGPGAADAVATTVPFTLLVAMACGAVARS